MSPVIISLMTVGMTFAMLAPISLYYSWAASILWGWFLVPLGAPSVTILQCWGIMLVIIMFRPRLSLQKSDDSELVSAAGALVLAPLLALGFGWAIKNWWM